MAGDAGVGDVRDHAVLEADERAGLVFVADVVPYELVVEAGHSRDAAGHEVQHPVDRVRPPEVERAAGLLLLRVPAVLGIPVSARGKLDVEDVANQPLLHRFVDRAEVPVVPAIVVHCQHSVRVARGLDHRCGLGHVEAHGLFDDRVLARASRGDRDRRMREMGRDDRHQIDIRLRQ